jgi:hypothetical protein
MKTKAFWTILFCLFTILSFAQYDGYNYQGVARDNNGGILSNQPISIRISILDGSVSGISEYIETHDVTTNQFGLFTLVTGRGVAVSGTFSSVTWSNAKFMKVEMDATGGINYSFMGTNELLMVPYAKYAETAGSSGGNGATYTGGNGITINNTTNEIINSKPDQTVALNAGNNVTITGTYPNFTITANGGTTGGPTYTGGTGININANDVISIPNNGISSSMIPNNTITVAKLNFTPLTNPFSGSFVATGSISAGNTSSSFGSGDIAAGDDLIADDNLLIGDDAVIMDNLSVPNGYIEVGSFSGSPADGYIYADGLLGLDIIATNDGVILGDFFVGGTASKPGGGSWTSSSDGRLKDIHRDYKRGLEEITAINPLFYNYKKDNPLELNSDKTYIGIIAQELQKVIPEAVTVDKDGYLVVNNDPIIWAMVNAIQELEQKNKDLEAAEKKIEDLEKRLATLEKKIK